MIRLEYDPKMVRDSAKYTLEIVVEESTQCCRVPRVVVRAKSGGYVLADCSKCNSPTKVSYKEFLSLSVHIICICTKCEEKMIPSMVPSSSLKRSNYGWICVNCEAHALLADFVPRYQDIGTGETFFGGTPRVEF